jgi:hypothetical protein
MDSWLESLLDPSTIAVAPTSASRTHDQTAVSAWPVPGEAGTDGRAPAIGDTGLNLHRRCRCSEHRRESHQEPHQTVSCIDDASVYLSFELVTDTVERRGNDRLDECASTSRIGRASSLSSRSRPDERARVVAFDRLSTSLISKAV